MGTRQVWVRDKHSSRSPGVSLAQRAPCPVPAPPLGPAASLGLLVSPWGQGCPPHWSRPLPPLPTPINQCKSGAKSAPGGEQRPRDLAGPTHGACLVAQGTQPVWPAPWDRDRSTRGSAAWGVLCTIGAVGGVPGDGPLGPASAGVASRSPRHTATTSTPDSTCGRGLHGARGRRARGREGPSWHPDTCSLGGTVKRELGRHGPHGGGGGRCPRTASRRHPCPPQGPRPVLVRGRPLRRAGSSAVSPRDNLLRVSAAARATGDVGGAFRVGLARPSAAPWQHPSSPVTTMASRVPL